MNFGPLSREGGYRRLNVAITRAKYNIKLVGSIVPTDIDLDKVSSEGVKMLRSYIEFAQQGIVALEKELTFNCDLEFDSPFEEAVYDFLQSNGYNVVTQVRFDATCLVRGQYENYDMSLHHTRYQ